MNHHQAVVDYDTGQGDQTKMRQLTQGHFKEQMSQNCSDQPERNNRHNEKGLEVGAEWDGKQSVYYEKRDSARLG